MSAERKDTVVHLQEDLTFPGATRNIVDSLAASIHRSSADREKLFIDCSRVAAADASGLQLLNVWMYCARTGGMELELVNLPDSLIQNAQKGGDV